MIQSITFGKELTVNDTCPTCGGALILYNEDTVICSACGYTAPSGYSFINPRNTYSDWHIIADERPVFQPPEAKTNYVDIPGGNGVLDLSESLTGYPIYENREGSFTFKVLNDYGEWADRYSEILNFLHGQSMKAILADDPSWFYQGRFGIGAWEAGDTWSEITIDYNVNPFKWSCCSSTSEWLWDPFNFENGVILKDTFSEISIDSFNQVKTCPECGANMYLNDDGDAFVCSACGYEISDTYQYIDFDAGLFGTVPIAPNITIVGDNTSAKTGMDIHFTNDYFGIDMTQTFYEGTTFAPDFIFYGATDFYTIGFRGNGIVSIDFRIGRL